MNPSTNLPVNWIITVASVVILGAVISSLGVLFFIPSPTLFQYRITTSLVCFALSSIAGLLFAAKVQLRATFGVFTTTLGGTAALWLAALVTFNHVFPEAPINRPKLELRLHLIFPEADSADLDLPSAKVSAMIRKSAEIAAKERPVKVDAGPGGIAVSLDGLEAGDVIGVTTNFGEKLWRSDPMVVPEAQLQMVRSGL